MVKNTETDTTDAFYLYYEPPALCGLGDSYLIQISSTGATQKLVRAKKYANMHLTGMTIVGNGADVALAQSAQGTQAKAKMMTLSGNTLPTQSTSYLSPTIETWKDLR